MGETAFLLDFSVAFSMSLLPEQDAVISEFLL